MIDAADPKLVPASGNSQNVKPCQVNLSALPKAELHLHLEGAISLNSMKELVEKYCSPNEVNAVVRNLQPNRLGSFGGFIESWRLRAQFLREYDDFLFAAQSVAEDLVAQQVIYAEIHFSPGAFARRYGLKPALLAEAVSQGFTRNTRGKLRVNLILDFVRNHGPEVGDWILDEITETLSSIPIVAVGLGGIEDAYDAELYALLFGRAEKLGLHRVVHAGEQCGPESVWSALRFLHAERIGHGIRSIEDPSLLVYLQKTQIPLEICLSSNLFTNSIADLKDHPIARFVQLGLSVVLSTDDPPMFDTNISREYKLAIEHANLTYDGITRLARASFEKAFVTDLERNTLLATFDAHWHGKLTS